MLTADRVPRSGKVRDLYPLPDGTLALVASDRISAFDVILPTRIPDKGKVLTGLSRFWFDETGRIVPNHLLGTDVGALPALESATVGSSESFDGWRGRVLICRPARVIPIEAVVRGYLAGSGWKEYRDAGMVCGIPLPPGLREGDRLPEPIFTPASKAPAGHHDENLSFDGAIDYVAQHFPDAEPAATGGARRARLERGTAAEVVEAVRDQALRLYGFGSAVAERAGILLADTKFEFGLPPGREVAGGQVMLIDETLTPDSSRFWDAATWAPGRPQPSFDKQFVRDWLEQQPWDKRAPGPALPDAVVDGTRARYVEAFERITGASFQRYLEEDVIG